MSDRLTTKRRPPYRVFRMNPGTPVLVLQVRDPETGEPTSPHELVAYRCRCKIHTPWHGLERLTAGSRLLLTPKTARFLIAAGSITLLEEPALILSRETSATAGRPDRTGIEARPARHGPTPAPAR